MPAWLIPAIISGVQALGGALANRKSKQQQTQQQQQNFDYTDTASTRPDLLPEGQDLLSALTRQYLSRLEAPEGAVSAITAAQMSNVNRGSAANRRVLSSGLSGRGIYGPLAQSLQARFEQDRIGQLVGIMNQEPLLLEDMLSKRLSEAGGFFSRIPVGQSSTTRRVGSSTGTGTTTGETSGNVLGGLFGNLAQALAGFYGQGAFGGEQDVSDRGFVPPQSNSQGIIDAILRRQIQNPQVPPPPFGFSPYGRP